MKSVEGKLIYEIVDSNGESTTAPYQSRKSLDASLAIAKKFDPLYHEKYKVRVMRIVFEELEEISPSPEPEPQENQLEEEVV